MRGFPSYFASKMDYLNCIKEYPEQTRDALKRLWNNRFYFEDVRVLEEEEEVPKNSFVSVRFDDEGNKIRVLLERKVDSRAKVYRLGFSDKEIQKLIEA